MCFVWFRNDSNKETDDDDDDVYEEGLETKNKIEKSVEKGLGRNIQFLGIGAVLRDVSPAFALEGGVVMLMQMQIGTLIRSP